MTFESVLFPTAAVRAEAETREPPACFRDLHLDQVVAGITAGFEPYDLAPFFWSRLRDPDAIAYRQEVMQDLEDPNLMEVVKAFAAAMRRMRDHLGQVEKRYYRYEKARWFLAAVRAYCDAVEQLAVGLDRFSVKSRGLRGFQDYLQGYLRSPAFQRLRTETRGLEADLAAVRFSVHIKGGKVTVRPYAGEADQSVAVEETFARFRRGAVKDYRVMFDESGDMNHIEAQVVDRVARLHPEPFATLDRYVAAHAGYLDETIARFDREIHFYVAYLGYVDRLRRAGLPFCYPEISARSKEVHGRDVFDLALAARRGGEGAPVVGNDFALRDPERIIVVTGPNQGGKTTFARAFGQLHYLAGLGCPVPGTEARLFLCDRIFTHFEREENITTLRGKLEDDLLRMREILDQATPQSLIIVNEIFASTTLRDAIDLGRRVMAEISRLDALAVCVTFLDELASFDAKTVSLVALVDPANPAVRTYRLERRPADGLAYALAIAEKYRVTYEWLRRRLGR
ncbi:MAG TPA: DNA mismatch repair protein MutS [Calidithermus sp.]|nr:DNA mismatch repair protein MutS [Calidithermus sp.]